jgi:hypothetical protein
LGGGWYRQYSSECFASARLQADKVLAMLGPPAGAAAELERRELQQLSKAALTNLVALKVCA